MKTRAVILAGGEGSRLSMLTAKRTKPAMPFGGKYRIIDFTLSNCVNSGIFDAMILAQYRPHSLIDHIGSGGPWDLNREFAGGVRIYTPYTARRDSDWYLGTADAVQQNFAFIKRDSPRHILILSGDHVYAMDYDALITFHNDLEADLTIATVRVKVDEASRFGIVSVNDSFQVTQFVEKPEQPESNLVNMGVYLFNLDVLDKVLLADHTKRDSHHDFGKDILPRLVQERVKVVAYPYSGYWVDVGTVKSYWKAHMDLLNDPPLIDLTDRSWIIHTRTEERPPVRFGSQSSVINSLICDGCIISPNTQVIRSILSPGVVVKPGAIIKESVILTDCIIGEDAVIENAILDKRVKVEPGARIGTLGREYGIALIGKNSVVPGGSIIEAGGVVGTDVIPSDYPASVVGKNEMIQTKRLAHEI